MYSLYRTVVSFPVWHCHARAISKLSAVVLEPVLTAAASAAISVFLGSSSFEAASKLRLSLVLLQ